MKSTFIGLGGAVIYRGFVGGTKRYFGYGMSHNYGASVSRWKRLDVDMSGIKHHWAISQKLMNRHPWLKPIGNQTWNLKRFGSQASHMRWGHGTAYGKSAAIPYWRLTYPLMSTPTWFKAGVTSGGLRIYKNYWMDDE